MRLSLCVTFLGLCLATSMLAAQTYTPKEIRFEGGGDRTELLALTGLEPGKPLTKTQIEAAMQKLADTGAFTDLSYTVSSAALLIKLGGATQSSGQARPVRYMNAVWWRPDELTPLLTAKVPLYHGELPLTSSLTDQVCAALVQLLATKGVANAKVEALPTGGVIALDITQPQIVLGNVQLSGMRSPHGQVEKVLGALSMQEFDSEGTAREIRENMADTEKNAGFLDATVDQPSFSAPRKDMNGYAVDAAAVVHPGELYTIGTVDAGARPPLSPAEALGATELKPGQPAGAMTITIAAGTLQRAYTGRGYLDAKVKQTTALDATTHTAFVQFTAAPGELYHLASVDTAALPTELRAGFAREFHGRPGMPAGSELDREVSRAFDAAGGGKKLFTEIERNTANHTVTLRLLTAPQHAHIAPKAP